MQRVLDICEGFGVSMAYRPQALTSQPLPGIESHRSRYDTIGDGNEVICSRSVKHEGHVMSIAAMIEAEKLGGFKEVRARAM